MANEINDHFKHFGEILRQSLAKYGKMDDFQLLDLQRHQLEKLTGLEKKFKEVLIKHPWGPGVYRRFCHLICEINGNVLTSRPYFRERQTTCTGPINKAIRAGDVEGISKYDANYQFVCFALSCRRFAKNSELRKIGKQIEGARRDIIELNLPLALSQARIFWSKSPAKAAYTHITHMDLVQSAADGLIAAVDKFVLPKSEDFPDKKLFHEEFRRFRPMIVQRIVGNAIETYSETSVHFYPNDRKKIYRAHKYLARAGGVVDYDKLAEYVNGPIKDKPIPKQEKTTASEIAELLSSASSVMVNGNDSDSTGENVDRGESFIEKFEDSANSCRPDMGYEQTEAVDMMRDAASVLSSFEIKILTLKGISF